jgi:hypothetical protein
MNKRIMLGPAAAMLAASLLLSACGGSSKAPASSSGSPAFHTSTGTPVVVLGGALNTVTPQGGALKGHTLPGGYLTVHVTEGSLLFVVQTTPTTAVFRCLLYALPQTSKVPISVTVKTTNGYKTYYVRPSKPLMPGPYQLRYGGSGRFEMALYEVGAS